MRGTIVFDLDGTLETPYMDRPEDIAAVRKYVVAEYGGEVFDRMFATVLGGMPHFFLNGALELLRWCHGQGLEIVFFSNAVRSRNEGLCPIMMERAFSDGTFPGFRLFSRPDCINLNDGDRPRDDFDGLWGGGYKKKLVGVVVPEDRISDTLMVEDDCSYACKGEEKNYIYARHGGSAHEFLLYEAHGRERGNKHEVLAFHRPFWFCGVIKRTLAIAESEGLSLADAAVLAQYADRAGEFPTTGEYPENAKGWEARDRLPKPPFKNFGIFKEGLAELRTVNPTLRFWGDVDESAQDWPEWAKDAFWHNEN